MKLLSLTLLLLLPSCAVMTRSTYEYNLKCAEIRGKMECYEQSWTDINRVVTKLTDPVLIHDTIYVLKEHLWDEVDRKYFGMKQTEIGKKASEATRKELGIK